MVIMLLGNKCDLPHLREVPTEMALEFARNTDMIFSEVSAYDGTNLSTAFLDLIRGIYAIKSTYGLPPSIVKSRSSVNLSKQILEPEQKGCLSSC